MLDAVSNYTLTTRNSSCLSLAWDKPVNAENESAIFFHVEYKKSDDSGEDVGDVSINTTETSLSVCGLDYWTEYRFNITAVGRGGAGKTVTGYGRTAEHGM